MADEVRRAFSTRPHLVDKAVGFIGLQVMSPEWRRVRPVRTTGHLPLTLDWLAEFFAERMGGPDAQIVVAALHRTKARLMDRDETAPAIYRLMPQSWPECAAFENALLRGDSRFAEALFDRCLFDSGGPKSTDATRPQGVGLVAPPQLALKPTCNDIALSRSGESQSAFADRRLLPR